MADVPRAELAPGYSIARVINGCWQLTPDHGGGLGSRKAALRRFAELVDHGFTTFDCADIYVGTEELLGEFRRTLADPAAIQVHTKFVPDKDALGNLDERRIDAVIDRSLTRLGVERLDLVQFHWWDYETPGLESMYERLLHLQSIGKIRLLGVTNFNTARLRGLLDLNPAIVSMQAQYSLVDRRPERELIPCCLDAQVGLLAYGVLAGGFLSARYLRQTEPDRMNRSLQKYRLIIDDAGGWDAFQRLLGLLDDIATKHDTSLDLIAARWVLDQQAVAAVILGMGRRSRIAANLSLGDIRLDDEDRERLALHLRSVRVPPGDSYDIERDPGSRHSRILKTNLQAPDVAR
jgi:aryl-alcohol dehydrogenase-like predicted oxidoreductase